MARVVVITGVSRGLGYAMSREFVRLGHTVVGCARGRSAVEGLRSEFPQPNRWDVVDVGDDAQVAEWAAAVLDAHAAPDLLLNNAALINGNASLWEISAAEFSQVVDVNIKGVFHLIRHFVPAMIARQSGVIVNFSSGWGRSASADVAPYCATKWAIEGLTASLAQELPASVAAVALNPGIIHTEMLDSCFGAGASSFPSPQQWASKAVPFLLSLGAANNGEPLTAPA